MKKENLIFCGKKNIYNTNEECLECFKSGHSGFSNFDICKKRNWIRVINKEDR
jgi:hypothetical protein